MKTIFTHKIAEITIFYTKIMMRKVDLRSFFTSGTSVIKYANKLFKSKFQWRTYFFYTNVRENKRFRSRFSTSCRKIRISLVFQPKITDLTIYHLAVLAIHTEFWSLWTTVYKCTYITEVDIKVLLW